MSEEEDDEGGDGGGGVVVASSFERKVDGCKREADEVWKDDRRSDLLMMAGRNIFFVFFEVVKPA